MTSSVHRKRENDTPGPKTNRLGATMNVYAEEDGVGLRDDDGIGGRAGREGGAKDAIDGGGGGGAEQLALGGNDEGVLQSTKTRMITAAGTLLSGHCCQLQRDWPYICLYFFSFFCCTAELLPEQLRQNNLPTYRD